MAEDPKENEKPTDAAGCEKETSRARSVADESGGQATESKAGGLWDKILLVFLGIALTSIATCFNANHQASLERQQQRQQFLMDKRIGALNEFADALKGSSDVFDKLTGYEITLLHVKESPESSKAWNEVYRAGRGFLAEIERWNAVVRARGVIMAAVFKVNFPPPSFPPQIHIPTSPFPRQREQRIALADRQLEAAQKLHTGMVSLLNDYQDELDIMAKEIY